MFIKIANSIKLIVLIYFTSTILCAGCFAFFESKPFIDSLWWTYVTSLTIGYGDVYPVTTGGRICAVVFGHLWILILLPMLIANIVGKIIIDHNEFTDREQQEMLDLLRSINDKVHR